jgi:hypothetical protein
VDSLSIALSADNNIENGARNVASSVLLWLQEDIMERDFGLTLLGVVAGGALLILAVYMTLNWTAARMKTAAVDLPAPTFFIPK